MDLEKYWEHLQTGNTYMTFDKQRLIELSTKWRIKRKNKLDGQDKVRRTRIPGVATDME